MSRWAAAKDLLVRIYIGTHCMAAAISCRRVVSAAGRPLQVLDSHPSTACRASSWNVCADGVSSVSDMVHQANRSETVPAMLR